MSAAGLAQGAVPRRSSWALAPLFGCVFFSGAAALVYETLWTRSFTIILGSTVQAASATFAAFLVGLAAGAWLFAVRLPSLRRTVRAYALVELSIAVIAPLMGMLVQRHADALAVWIGSGTSYRVFSAFGTVLAIVLLPTLFMGATFPLMLACARRLGAPLTAVGRVYAVNTFGAALGTLCCGFVLIRTLGVPGSLWVGSGCNVLAALLCLPLMRLPLAEPGDEAMPEPHEAGRAAQPAADSLLLAVAATSGVLILGLEVVWTRFASYFVGNRTYAFTALLACVLVLLAMGSWLSALLVGRFGHRPHALLGWIMTVGAASSVAAAAGGWWWIQHQAALEPLLPASRQMLISYRVLETFALLAPPLLSLGCLFPASLMCSRMARRSTGHAAGRFYVANTAGSVVGSLGVGFFGMSTVGTFGCVVALAFVCAAFGLLWFGSGLLRGAERRSHVAGLASLLLLVLLLPAMLPAHLTLLRPGENLLFRREDEYGVMQVEREPGGSIRVTNNRTELIYRLGLAATSYVQEMQGHLPVFHRPDARSAAVIGSGYGVTAGALTRYPGMREIVAVEIIPGMVEAADLFFPYNYAYHRDPRVEVVVGDGRHYLASTDRSFDIITINVSDPHLPGGSSLFHSDFYGMVKRHLNPGGVIVQHAFGSGVEIILRTILASFRDVRLYPAYGNGYNVVASDRSLDVAPERADALLDAPTVREALAQIGVLPPVTPSRILAAGLHRSDVEAWLRPGEVASDDHPAIEFSWSANPAAVLFSNE